MIQELQKTDFSTSVIILIINGKGYWRKQSWPNLNMYLSQYISDLILPPQMHTLEGSQKCCVVGDRRASCYTFPVPNHTHCDVDEARRYFASTKYLRKITGIQTEI